MGEWGEGLVGVYSCAGANIFLLFVFSFMDNLQSEVLELEISFSYQITINLKQHFKMKYQSFCMFGSVVKIVENCEMGEKRFIS